MAATETKQSAAGGAGGTSKAAAQGLKPPAGFVDAGTPDIDGWFKPEKGMVLFGQIVSAIKIPDDKAPSGKRDVVLVRLKDKCKAVKDQETVMLEPGQVIGVGIRHQLTEMLLYVEHKGEVWTVAKEQVSIGHGQTMWKFEGPFFKGTKSSPPERLESGAAMPRGPVPF